MQHPKNNYSKKRTREKKRKKGKLRRYSEKFDPELPEYCMVCDSREDLVKHIPDGAKWHDILVACPSCLSKLTMHLTDSEGIPLIQEIPDLIDIRNLPKHPPANTLESAKAKLKRFLKKYPHLTEDINCQICGEENTIKKITNPNKPYKINILCRSCSYHTDTEDLPKKIDLLEMSEWEVPETEISEKDLEYTRRCTKNYMAHYDISSPPYCQVCGGEIKDGHINTFHPNPQDAYQVYFACDFCYKDAQEDDFWKFQVKESNEELMYLPSLV